MNRDDLVKELQGSITGEIHGDPITKQVYSVDASIYEVEPEVIVIPRSKKDIIKIVRIAAEFGIPITARGAATGITGGCLGSGLIIDTSKYLNHILEINIEQGYAICEPGVVQDDLNNALGKFGYRLGPDTSTGNRATLGGMVGNNAAGAHSLKFGCMADHVEAVDVVLANGESVSFSTMDLKEWQQKCAESPIYAEAWHIREHYGDEIKNRFPNIPRRVSGYNLNALLKPDKVNLSTLIAGSEGTLGVMTAIKISISPVLKDTSLCILHFNTMNEAMSSLDFILSHHPIAVEMIDRKIIEMGRLSPSVRNKLDWLKGNPEVVLVVEFENSLSDNSKLAQSFGDAAVSITNSSLMSHVWDVRKAGLTLLLSKRSYQRAIAFIEDISVPPQGLPVFMDDFCRYLKDENISAGIYGHAGSGCMHIRPYIDLRYENELKRMKKIILDVSDLLLKHQGVLSGEHGDGLVRSWLNKKMFGEKLYQAFVDIKQAFDPRNLMNPGKIVHPTNFLDNLRMSPSTPIIEPATILDFSKEGGLSLAADLCNGNGLCRKKEKTMCPSFQATNDEYHTTRARAQALRSILHGKLPIEELSGEGLHDVLDLCLQCKGCKTECPSQVDMAKMKSEILYHYHKKHGISFRDRMFANVRLLNKMAYPFRGIFNKFAKSKSLFKLLNIAKERELPLMAQNRFSSWYKTWEGKIKNEKKVVIISDTFTEFHSPEVGIAAVKVLQRLGYEVIVYAKECCGRPLLSKGLLLQAKKQALHLIADLLDYAEQNIPIIGLEPSCLFTIKDDFFGLLGANDQNLAKVCQNLFLFDVFIENQLPLPFKEQKRTFLLHGHCYQKALIGMGSTLNVLKSIPGAVVKEIPSGCCGMAGAFGYEQEHYRISMKIGELCLFPAINEVDDVEGIVIAANGFSCRHQIMHGTKRHSLHLAEVLETVMKNS